MGLVRQPDIDPPTVSRIGLTVDPPTFPHRPYAAKRSRWRNVGRAGKARYCDVATATLRDVKVQQHVPGGIGAQIKPDMPAYQLTVGYQGQARFDAPRISPSGFVPFHRITCKNRREKRLEGNQEDEARTP